MSTQYFASLPTAEIAGELMTRIKNYYHSLMLNRQLHKIRKSYDLYYGLGDYQTTEVFQGGDEGELLEIRVNHLRSLIQHILVLTTQNRPALKAVAVNSDYSSQADAKLADSLIDYYFKTRNLETLLKDATELALITGQGYVCMRWNAQEGQEYGVTETGAVIYDGDIDAYAKSCLEIIRDIYEEKPSWFIERSLRNKYDLAAQYPDLADKITGLSNDGEDRVLRFDPFQRDDQNLIPHYTFYHRKSPAMPNGRIVEFLDGEIVLIDGPLPYREPPIYPISPATIRGTQLGYTPAFDLLSLADSYNELFSGVLTALSTFTIPNLWSPPGNNVDTRDIAGGLNLIEADRKPEPIQFNPVPDASFKGLEMAQSAMEVLSGVNDVLRGNPQASLKSGSALALVASQALAYNSGLQQSYCDLLQSVGNAIIHLLQDYASTPKVATIVGVADKSMLKQFTGENLKTIDRVTVEQVSAVSKTTAGRMELAQNLLQAGLFTSPEQYLMLIETGSLEPLTATRTAEIMLIRQENEAMRDGQQVQAILVDLHGDHIRGHKEVLADPVMRQNPQLVQTVLAHIQEHMNLLQQMDPGLLAVLKEDQIPPPQPKGPPQMTPQAAGQPPQGPAQPRMPNMPHLPSQTPPQIQQAYQQMQQK